MDKLESCIQREIMTYLERCGWYVIKLIQTNKNGIVDLEAIKNGQVIFIEVKRPGEEAKPLQVYRLKELTDKGVLAFVAHSIEEVKTTLKI